MFCNECVKRQKCHLFWKNSDVILECSDFKKAITNADRIRSMPDDELARLLTDVAKKAMCEVSKRILKVDLSNYDSYFRILDEAHLEWLKQEDKDDERRRD